MRLGTLLLMVVSLAGCQEHEPQVTPIRDHRPRTDGTMFANCERGGGERGECANGGRV